MPQSTPERGESGEGAPLDTLQGTVERVTYADEESLYTVLKLSPEKGYDRVSEYPGLFSGRVTAVGKTPRPTEGLRVRLSGHWVDHRTHGLQFEFESLVVLEPENAEGLVRYLSSGFFKGIGETLAKRIVERLGTDALRTVLEHPEQLAGIRGLRSEVCENLVSSLRSELGAHEALAFLRGLDLGPVQSAAVLSKLGADCERAVRDDPYVIGQGVTGISFGIADRAAAKLGIEGSDPRRLRAGLRHALARAGEDGHSLLPVERLASAAAELLRDSLEPEAVEQALEELQRRDEVVIEAVPAEAQDASAERRVYLPWLAASERGLALHLAELARCGPLPELAGPAELAESERQSGIELHRLQREAVLGLLATPLGLMTGGPGVGKTTIVRSLVALAQSAGARVLLASPTGRAAKRLSEATGHAASTVHRLLGYESAKRGFAHNAQDPLEADLVIVDEISMLDVVLAHHLLKAIQPPTRLILVGDPDQLPSVGPGDVLRELIASDCLPVYRLTQIYRQAEESLIVTNAHRILRGESPLLPDRGDRNSDFYFFPADDPRECAQRTVEVVTQRIPQTFGLNWIEDVQVLSPMYRGECGVDALNERLREELAAGGREVRRGNRTWRNGDRVVHTRNDYERQVFNGDMGRIVGIEAEGQVHVKFPERELVYTGSELSDLQPAFAITVHRSQGGEYPAIVMPLLTQHYMMLQLNLLYTAITRARKLVVLVGSLRALSMALENTEQNQRESALKERLQSHMKGTNGTQGA